MSIIKQDYGELSGGISLNPSNIFKATVNANSAGVSINVTNGKMYLVIFDDDSSVDTTATGCQIIYKDISNSASWGNKYVYVRYLIVKATSDAISFTNSQSQAYDMVVTQLN